MRMILLLLLGLGWPAWGQEKLTEHTWKLSSGQKPPEATIGMMRWFAGTWSGEGLGGFNQEVWTDPIEGSMLGMFRHLKAGKPGFYELMTLTQEQGTLVMRIKHFNPPELAGWEEKDRSEVFRFVGKKGEAVCFEGLTYEPDGSLGARVYVAHREKDGKYRELSFQFTRSR